MHPTASKARAVERHADRAAYQERIQVAAQTPLQQRFLLPFDAVVIATAVVPGLSP